MSGMNSHQNELWNAVMGYDDRHRSSESSRQGYMVAWNWLAAKPTYYHSLHTARPSLRVPCCSTEDLLCKIVATTLRNMRDPQYPRNHGR